MEEIIAQALFILITSANLIGLRRTGLVLPHYLFLVFNLIMGVGILHQLDFGLNADISHAVIIFLTAAMYFMGSIFSASFLRLRSSWCSFKSNSRVLIRRHDFRVSIAWYFLSLAAAAFYFYIVGYNLIAVALSGDIDVDYISLRLGAYSGEEYYAPGYFNQFKNTILPWSYLTIATFLWLNIRPIMPRLLICFLLLLPVIFSLLGTGQRAFFVQFVIVISIYAVLAKPAKLKFKRVHLAVLSVTFFGIFSVMSFILGRSESFGIVDGFDALTKRIFYDQQIGAVVGFRYIFSFPVQYGAEWWRDLIGVLPGYGGSDLSHIVHGLLYGSMRGTAPVSMWTSVFYNWGWIGVVIFPVILGFSFSLVSRVMMSRKIVTAPTVAGFAFISFLLASWVSSGPMQLLNNGLLTMFLAVAITNAIDRGGTFSAKA